MAICETSSTNVLLESSYIKNYTTYNRFKKKKQKQKQKTSSGTNVVSIITTSI